MPIINNDEMIKGNAYFLGEFLESFLEMSF